MSRTLLRPGVTWVLNSFWYRRISPGSDSKSAGIGVLLSSCDALSALKNRRNGHFDLPQSPYPACWIPPVKNRPVRAKFRDAMAPPATKASHESGFASTSSAVSTTGLPPEDFFSSCAYDSRSRGDSAAGSKRALRTLSVVAIPFPSWVRMTAGLS